MTTRDAREVCELHGWVGRAAFQRDRHDLCTRPVEESAPAQFENFPTNPIPAHEEHEGTDGNGTANADTAGYVDEDKPRRSKTRRRDIPPKKTIAVRRITQLELRAGRAELETEDPYERPKTRGDCVRVPRPCPYVACAYNLYLDLSKTGSIILNFPHLEPGEMPANQSCALDLAEQGGMTLEEIATVTNLTRERIRQIELKTLIRRARPAAIALGLSAEDAAEAGTRRRVGPGQDLAETGVEGELPSDILAGGG